METGSSWKYPGIKGGNFHTVNETSFVSANIASKNCLYTQLTRKLESIYREPELDGFLNSESILLIPSVLLEI